VGRAQTAPDRASVHATKPDEAAPTGSGLFEQSSTPPSSASAAAPAALPPFTLSGYARGDAFVGKVPGFRRAETKAAYGELSLAVKTAKQRHGDGYAEARVRYGLQGDQQQTFLDLREAYVNGYFGPVDLRFGKQIIVWGRADALNPTNNLTPFDIRIRSPVEDDRRLGNVGARVFVNLAPAPLRVEGVWMPLYVPSELPPVGLPEFVTFTDPTFPRPDVDNGLFAGRLHLELPAFELSVSYLHGYAPLPGITLASVTFDPQTPSVRVSRTAYDQHVVGFDFSTAISDLVAIRAEAAFRRPADYQNKIYAARPDLQYVLGLDRAFGAVSVIAQYVGRYVFDWQHENGPAQPLQTSVLMADPSPLLVRAVQDAINQRLAMTNQILFSQTARVQHAGTLRVEWLTSHETLSLSALGFVNFTTGEWLAAPKIGYHVSDAILASVGAEIFVGPENTLFGLIQDVLSAGYAELRYTF
jgi:hypothetical protein